MTLELSLSSDDLFSAKKESLFTEGWSDPFFRASSLFAEPVCKAFELLRFRLVMPLDPKKFDNYPTTLQEVAFRATIVAGAVFAGCAIFAYPLPILFAALALGSAIKILRAIGVALQTDGFTYVRGGAPEKPTGSQVKVMTWNMCGICGGLHYDHGGVISWRGRLDRMIEVIRREDPDVLILQEIYDTELGEALKEKLGPSYAHFFTHLGPNVWGSEGGLMVATKNEVSSFSHTSFENNDWTLNRGFASLELKNSRGEASIRILGTHLIHGSDNEKRKVQVEQINKALAEKQNIPTVIAGDLNIERDKEGRSILSPHLIHGYQGSEATCTNELVAQWTEKGGEVAEETIDYISLFKKTLPTFGRVRIEECRALLDAYDPKTFDTTTALSDHKPLVGTVRGF